LAKITIVTAAVAVGWIVFGNSKKNKVPCLIHHIPTKEENKLVLIIPIKYSKKLKNGAKSQKEASRTSKQWSIKDQSLSQSTQALLPLDTTNLVSSRKANAQKISITP